MSDGLGGRPNLAALTDLYSLVCPHKYLDETVKIPLTLLTQKTLLTWIALKKMLIFWKLMKCQSVPEYLCLHFRAI